MGSCCSKPPAEPPPGANGRVVVENTAFDAVRAAERSGPSPPPPPRPRAATATPGCDRCKAKIQFCTCNMGGETAPPPSSRKLQVVRGKATATGGKAGSGAAQPRRVVLSARGPAKQQPPPKQRQQQSGAGQRQQQQGKKRESIGQSQRPAAKNSSSRRRPPLVKRLVLSANDLARKCAGLGWDDGQASYADSGAAKVQKAIKKVREGKATTAAALAALKKTQHVPRALLKLAQGEVVRAIGVTRFDVLNAEVQWKEQGSRDGSREGEAVIKDRQTLLDALRMQVEFACKLGIATLVEKDAELNAAVDAAASASAAGSFATAVAIVTDTGLDMRLVAGVLALREVTSEVAKDAVYFDAGPEYNPYDEENPGFTEFQENLKRLHATATAPLDAAAVAATNALFRIFPGVSTAKLDAMAKLVPSILKDVAIYNDMFAVMISSTPQAVFDELKRLAATPSQLPDWKSRIKNHPGDPAPDSLEYLMVARHRAADDSITFYNSVHMILATKLPAGCQAAAMPGLVKAEQRIIFKTALSYSGNGCFGRCNDIVRLTIRVETMEEVLMVLKALLGSEAILVLRQKHRLDPDKDMSMIGGYRDYQLLVTFKREAASVATDGGPEYAVGEIQINLANFIDIKEGVAAGGGGGHGPYKLARSFNGYSPETVAYVGAPSMALVRKIERGMLLSVTIAGGSESSVDNLEDVGNAIAEALVKPTCRVQELDFGWGQDYHGTDLEANPKLIGILLPILPSMVGLTRLNIAGYQGVELPEWLSKLVNLQSLNLSGCRKLKKLPEGLSKLVNLQSLDLSYCENLTMLPEGLSKLGNLQSLNLSSCENLTMLPEWMSKLVNLQSLNLKSCEKLTMLPEGLSKLVNLQSLNLSNCSNLTTLPEGLSKLVNLQSLNLWACEKLTMLPEGLSKLVNLQSLDLGFCRNLTMLPNLSELLPTLKIKDMPSHLSDWKARGLDAYNFMTDEPITGVKTTTVGLFHFQGSELPEWVSKLVILQSLNLNGCDNLTVLPEGLGKLVNLQLLSLNSCWRLAEPLPDLSHLLPALTVKNVDYASDAAKAWEKRGFKRL